MGEKAKGASNPLRKFTARPMLRLGGDTEAQPSPRSIVLLRGLPVDFSLRSFLRANTGDEVSNSCRVAGRVSIEKMAGLVVALVSGRSFHCCRVVNCALEPN